MRNLTFAWAAVAVLGTVLPVAAQDENASPSLFERLDSNGDGFLTRDEIDQEGSRFFDRLIRLGDTNDDEKLDRAEWDLAASQREERSETSPQQASEDPDVREFQRERDEERPGSPRFANPLFERGDKNGDGKLSADEYFQAEFEGRREQGRRRDAESEERQRQAAAAMIRRADRDGDGLASREELRALMQETQRRRESGAPQSPDIRSFADRLFDAADANGDDTLSREEVEGGAPMLRRLLERKGGDSLTRKDVQEGIRQMREARTDGATPPGSANAESVPRSQLLRRMDRDGDGRLTEDEMPAEMRERMQSRLEAGGGFIDLDRLFANQQDEDRAQAEDPERRRDRQRPADREGDRPRETDRPRDGDRPRPPLNDREGDRPRPPLDREGRPGGPPPGAGMAFMRLLDTDNDRRLSKEELESAAAKMDELDNNNDGYLDAAELMGFGADRGEGFRERFGGRGEGFRGPGLGDRGGFRPSRDTESERPERPRRPGANESAEPEVGNDDN